MKKADTKARPVRKNVLFFCLRNAARSQMAEALLRDTYGDKYEAHSAGMMPSQLTHPAIQVMAEIGIDISGYRAKPVEEFVGVHFDTVAIVCSKPNGPCPFLNGEKCLKEDGCGTCCAQFPFFPQGTTVVHAPLASPPENQDLTFYRNLRDAMRVWIEETFGDQ